MVSQEDRAIAASGTGPAPFGLSRDASQAEPLVPIANQYDDFDEEEYDPDAFAFECAGYYPEPAGEFYCPLWGTEECDWECPHGGMA